MRFSISKDGKYVGDVSISSLSSGRKIALGWSSDDIVVSKVYIEERGFPKNFLAVDFIGYGQHGELYRGYAVELPKT